MKAEVSLTATELAARLGIARSTLYYHPILPERDLELKTQIQEVWKEFPEYGSRRLATELGFNRKRLKRVMRYFGLKPPRRRVRLNKEEDLGKAPSPFPNLPQTLTPAAPNIAWVADFTYLLFQGEFLYLATVLDMFTREVLGWNILSARTVELVRGAFEEALLRAGTTPYLLHSDQGSQYTATEYLFYLEQRGIKISMSEKSSPWQNPHQESYYSQFKLELGDPNRFQTLGELVTQIQYLIHRYNTRRIHSALNMSPVSFREQLYLESSSRKLGLSV